MSQCVSLPVHDPLVQSLNIYSFTLTACCRSCVLYVRYFWCLPRPHETEHLSQERQPVQNLTSPCSNKKYANLSWTIYMYIVLILNTTATILKIKLYSLRWQCICWYQWTGSFVRTPQGYTSTCLLYCINYLQLHSICYCFPVHELLILNTDMSLANHIKGLQHKPRVGRHLWQLKEKFI